MRAHPWRLPLLLSFLLQFICCCALADSPPVVRAQWRVTVDPASARLEWPDSLKVDIPQPDRFAHVVFPRSPSQFVMVGLSAYEADRAELWNLATGKRVGTMQGTPSKSNKKALSPHGKYYAQVTLGTPNEAQVWDLTTGMRASEFKTFEENGMVLALFDFLPNDDLLTYAYGVVSGKVVHSLRVWNPETGATTRQWTIEKAPQPNDFAISPGGRWLATSGPPEITFFDLETGQQSGTITPPKNAESGMHVSPKGLMFSPDGTEFAVLCDGLKDAVLTVYDVATGEEKFHHPLSAAMKSALVHPASYEGPPIEYVAQPKGFLWYGSAFIERESGLMPWTYRQHVLEHNRHRRTLTPAGFIASVGPASQRQIRVLPFPAAEIEQSLVAYREEAPALVKPGEKVKVIIKVTAVRFGKPDDARKSLEEVFALRLADDGLEVSKDAGTQMLVTYKEAAGQMLKEIVGGNPITGGGTPTGRTVQSTAVNFDMKWTTKDGKTVLYEDKIEIDPRLLIIAEKEATEEAARKQVFEIVKLRLAGLPLPYFVPLDKSLPRLPMVTHSEKNGPESPQDAIKRKLEAKQNARKKIPK